MPKHLERDLGLLATITISIGAMIGSGIFVLPGLAADKAGPAVILAYFLAGLIVLPAALSKAEMATAMPEAGGTYLYIDRSMGPLLGTVAGVGAWFSLVFKSAFALVGLGAYLVLFAPLPRTPTALALAALLVIVNVLGVKQTGRLQAVIVTTVLVALALFIGDGITYVDGTRFHPFFGKGSGGLLAATGFVFVSYAGVTKIASVAEEVEDPGRNIPLAMLGSVLLMMLVYTLVVFVVVGVVSLDLITDTITPMAVAAGSFAGPVGTAAVAVVAVLALTSMANAGVLSSSRFPFAMSRDDLAPERLGVIGARFQTPVVAILATGGLLLVLVGVVPVLQLAKLASAFKILVFSLVNVAVIAFRESELESYDPSFVAPGYPWVQLFGVGGGLLLLTQMGPVAYGGAVGIVVVGLVWYRLYGREKTEREGAALDAIRRSMSRGTLDRTEQAFDTGNGTVLVAVGTDTGPDRIRALARVGGAVAEADDGRLRVARFESVPEQTTLESVIEPTPADAAFEREVEAATADLAVPVEIEEIVTHSRKRAVVNVAEDVDADVVFGEWEPDYLHAELLGTDVDWYMNNAPCDVAFFRDRGLTDVSEVAVLAEPGYYSAEKVAVADAIARHHDATVRFVTAVRTDASAELVAAAEDFYGELESLSSVATEWELVRTDDRVDALADATTGADLVVLGTVSHSTLQTLVFGDVSAEISDRVDGSVVLFHPRGSNTRTFLRKVLERVAFGSTKTESTASTAD